LLGPSNIDIGELLVSMQFAVYDSTPELYVASNSETSLLDDGSSVIIEDEEDAEVIVENEETVLNAEVEEETSNSAEDQEGVAVTDEDPGVEEDGNNERNVSDVISPEVNEHVLLTSKSSQNWFIL
jgi:hypothetical protein